MPKGVRIIKGLNLKNENMVSLIFTLKKSLIKSFGFEKKVYGSVQYISVMCMSKNSLPWRRTATIWESPSSKILLSIP